MGKSLPNMDKSLPNMDKSLPNMGKSLHNMDMTLVYGGSPLLLFLITRAMDNKTFSVLFSQTALILKQMIS